MYRKGALDKGIMAMPIFFAVFALMILFVLICSGVLTTKKLSDREGSFSAVDLPVVFEKLHIKNESGQIEETTFVEGVRRFGLRDEMREALKEVAPEKGCMFVYYKAMPAIKGVEQDAVMYQDKVESESSISDDFFGSAQGNYLVSSQVRNYTFSFTGDVTQKYLIKSYSGVCLDE